MGNALPDNGTRTERRPVLRNQIRACNPLTIGAPPNPENHHRDKYRSPNIRHCSFSVMHNQALTAMAGFLIRKYSARKFSGLQRNFCVITNRDEAEREFTSLFESIECDNAKQLRLIRAGVTFATRPQRETVWR